MKLWLISQDQNGDYDTYVSAVVAAETKAEAQRIHPRDGSDIAIHGDAGWWVGKPSLVKVKFLGEAKEGTEKGVICASFNAG